MFSIHHFLAQLGHDEFEHPVLHISHIKEVVILEKENFLKRKNLTQFNSAMVFCLDFALSVTGTANPSPSSYNFEFICVLQDFS